MAMSSAEARNFEAIAKAKADHNRNCPFPPHTVKMNLVERELVGGECSYYACMPSKSLLRPGDLVDEAERVAGVRLERPPLDPPAVLRRRDEVIHDLDDSSQLPWLEKRGVEVLRGHGR